ncbi:glycosyltransferase [Pseudanabaena sp. FACHB-1277]|uniref:Glycosyltransferase n=1 Tax=Pseudanabaena cinerea FACHB-1277 TaxID=2949581 RepID=A0A926UWR3_9CYAN|nr:glycosyltransferase [Pseudanabaena cinerea]MBD2152296.1 glycosyltransferase [Pseudanabaena cinerea FACHB-1277]
MSRLRFRCLCHPLRYGGPSKSVLELTQAIGSLGIDIDLVTTNANGTNQLDVPLYTWIEKRNYRIQYFSYWNIFDYKFTMSLTYWLFKNIQNYDIVHTNAIFSYPNLPAYWACQVNHIPYVVTPRGMLEPWALAYKAWKKNLYFSLLEKPALEKASCIHMLASTEAERIQPLGLKMPIEVVPNGIHREQFNIEHNPDIFYKQFPETRNKKLIIFLGRIDPKKGLDLLAIAFKAIHQQFQDMHLVIAGPDNVSYGTVIKQHLEEYRCLDAVTFTGILTGELKYAALAAARIYVAPSYSEGFSMSVLEGMAAGLPCVITTGCNFPEAAEVAKIVGINSEEIIEALVNLLKHPDQAKEMGDRARQFILEKYTWEQIAARMKAIYNKILSRQA